MKKIIRANTRAALSLCCALMLVLTACGSTVGKNETAFPDSNPAETTTETTTAPEQNGALETVPLLVDDGSATTTLATIPNPDEVISDSAAAFDFGDATATTTTTTAATTTAAESDRMPWDAAPDIKEKGSPKVASMAVMPIYQVKLPDYIDYSDYMYVEEKEMCYPLTAYSNSRFGLGVMLHEGPSTSYALSSSYPIPYGAPVEVYTKYKVTNDPSPREKSYDYCWVFCNYNGTWGWCEEFELTEKQDQLIDTSFLTMPDRYYDNYTSNTPSADNSGYYVTLKEGIQIKNGPWDGAETSGTIKKSVSVRLLGTTIPESSWQFALFIDGSRQLLGWINVDSDGIIEEAK
ncbi:MAG: hypothetical protein K6B74_07280 [Ruminococcus sp.]|nr:hypothetical protein [Ruminococcus sp.]